MNISACVTILFNGNVYAKSVVLGSSSKFLVSGFYLNISLKLFCRYQQLRWIIFLNLGFLYCTALIEVHVCFSFVEKKVLICVFQLLFNGFMGNHMPPKKHFRRTSRNVEKNEKWRLTDHRSNTTVLLLFSVSTKTWIGTVSSEAYFICLFIKDIYCSLSEKSLTMWMLFFKFFLLCH